MFHFWIGQFVFDSMIVLERFIRFLKFYGDLYTIVFKRFIFNRLDDCPWAVCTVLEMLGWFEWRCLKRTEDNSVRAVLLPIECKIFALWMYNISFVRSKFRMSETVELESWTNRNLYITLYWSSIRKQIDVTLSARMISRNRNLPKSNQNLHFHPTTSQLQNTLFIKKFVKKMISRPGNDQIPASRRKREGTTGWRKSSKPGSDQGGKINNPNRYGTALRSI